MGTWIALLRGIGGAIRTLPMAELKATLEAAKLRNVRTFIHTGNVVFDDARTAAELSTFVSRCIEKRFGFHVDVVVVTPKELERAIAENPFPAGTENPKALHLFFLAAAPKPNLARMREIKQPTEEFEVKKKVFYFYSPEGFGISKLGASAEKLLGVTATARNIRTATKLLAFATSDASSPVPKPPRSPKRATPRDTESAAVDSTTSERHYRKVVAALVREPHVTYGGKGFGSKGLKLRGKLFALLSPKGEFVVKLPKDRVSELVQRGKAKPFGAGRGRVMKEWAAFDGEPRTWLALAKEALNFARA